MAERQNSKNPIPSNAMADLNDNAMSFDRFVNSSEQYVEDRFGNRYKTIAQILKELNVSIQTVQDKSFLPIAGGSMSGALSIRRKDPFLKLEDVSGNLAEIDVNSSNFYIQVSEPDLLSKKTRVRYNTDSKNFIFENINDLTINGESAIKNGDYGIGKAKLLGNLNLNSLNSNLTAVQNSVSLSKKELNYPNDYAHGALQQVMESSGWTSQIYHDFVRNSLFIRFRSYSGAWTEWNELISTNNIKQYIPQSVVLYPGGSATNLPILNKADRIVIDNPFKTRNAIAILEININGEWGGLNSVYSAVGAKASLLNDNKIVIQAGTSRLVDQTQGNCGSPWENKTHIYSAPYCVRVIKLGD